MKYNIDTEKFMDYKCTAYWIFTSQTHLCNQHPDQENRILPAPQRVPSGSLPATTFHPWGCSLIQHFFIHGVAKTQTRLSDWTELKYRFRGSWQKRCTGRSSVSFTRFLPMAIFLHNYSTVSKPRNRHWYHLPSTHISPVLYALILCVYFYAMLSLVQIHVTIITINIHNCFISTRLPPALPIITIPTPLLLNPGNCSSVLHNFVTSRILNK